MDVRKIGFGAVALLALAGSAMSVAGCEDDPAGSSLLSLPEAGAFDANRPGTSTPDASTPDSAPPGGPVAVFGAMSFDLGAGDCGGAAATKSVTFQNTGTKDLTVNLTASGAPFTVTPTSLIVTPGATGTVTVTAAVPASASAGVAITGTVTVVTNDPAKASGSVPVTVTPRGATLAFDTGSASSADFGTQKIDVAAANKTLTVVNKGNQAASFAFGNPADTQFGLTTTPASPANLAAGATATVTASFTPNKLTPSTSVSNITATGAICGASLTKIDFSGQGTIGNVTGFPTTALDFGPSPCGGAARAAQSFTLTSSGAVPVTLTSISFGGNKGYQVNRTNGAVVPANGSLVVTVTPPAIPSPSAVPGDYGDTLTILTDIAGDGAHQIPVSVTAQGAILSFDTSATAGFGSFGTIPKGTTASHPFVVTNTGNAAAAVTASAGAPFGVTLASFNLGANGQQALSATFTPAVAGPQTGSLGINASGLCQPLPSNLPLSGTGQDGGVSLSTNALSFSAECNTTATPQTFMLNNIGAVPVTWTGVRGKGNQSDFNVSSAGGTLAVGASITITVSPKKLPNHPPSVDPATFADTFTITTDIAGDTPKVVSLGLTPIGAVLAFQPNTLPFGQVPVNTMSAALPFTVVNTGNPGSAATITLASSSAPFALTTTNGVSAPGSSFGSSVTFSPLVAGSQTSNVTIATTSRLCAALPAAVATGTGTAGMVVATPTSVDFGNVNCGATAGPKTVTFSNPGNQDYTITNVSLAKGTYFTASMSPASGLVPANDGGTVVVTLTPNAIPQTVPSVPDPATYSDTLTVTTNAANDTPHVIPVTMGAQGVILTPIASKNWAFGTVNFGATGFYAVGIRNDGNVSVPVSLTGTTTSVFGLNPNPTTIAGSTSTTLTGTFTPTSSTASYADTAQLTVPTGTVLCQALPSYDLTLTGQGGDGPVIYITGSLSFLGVDCNAPANAPLSVTIHNTTSTPKPYTTGFSNGFWYQVTAGGSGTVPANGTATVTVTPNQITTAAGAFSGSATYADQLIVNIDGTSLNTPITQTARGADIIGSYETSATYTSFTKDPYSGGLVCARNAGNYSINFNASVTDGQWSTSPSPLALPTGGVEQCQRQRFTPSPIPQTFGCSTVGTFTSNVTSTAPVCHRDIPVSFSIDGIYCNPVTDNPR